MTSPLLLEIGCEEIPARMIAGAAADLADRVGDLLDGAYIARGAARGWGGSRRLAVRVEDVGARQEDRDEEVLGPPAKAAFGPDGTPTAAGIGFARKLGVDPAHLMRVETDKGAYAALRRTISGRTLEEVLRSALPRAVETMSFPKTMRWGEGRHRWVRPIHWLLAIHGSEPLALSLFDVDSSGASRGHRFFAPGTVPVAHPDTYAEALRGARVVAAPEERRRLLATALARAAAQEGAEVIEDDALLEEVADLVEWPGVVAGRFDETFLKLPREVLVTTLRHHQKCFSTQSGGVLRPIFLAVANTDRDPAGHVRRGNEWVVTGRLEDARFFWDEDRKRPLADRASDLRGVVFHQKLGTYADKAARLQPIATGLASMLGLGTADARAAREAAFLAKADLVVGLVGEFPELQGIAGGLLLRHEGGDPSTARAVYEHYRPVGADDAVPQSLPGAVVALADRLDSLAGCFAAGLAPTGSRDPLALRRAGLSVLRIVLETGGGLAALDVPAAVALAESAWAAGPHSAAGTEALLAFLKERLAYLLVQAGRAPDTVEAVLAAGAWARPVDAARRAAALDRARAGADFAMLAALHKRIRKILEQAAGRGEPIGPVEEGRLPEDADKRLYHAWRAASSEAGEQVARGDYEGALARIAVLRDPVHGFFDAVLVMSGGDTQASRLGLLRRVSDLFTAVADFSCIVAGSGDDR